MPACLTRQMFCFSSVWVFSGKQTQEYCLKLNAHANIKQLLMLLYSNQLLKQ